MHRAAALVHHHWPSLRLPALQGLLHRAWQALTLDADERFLRGATGLADLEQRLRRLERGRSERLRPLHHDGRDA